MENLLTDALLAAVGVLVTALIPVFLFLKAKSEETQELVAYLVLALMDGELTEEERRIAKEKWSSLVKEQEDVLD